MCSPPSSLELISRSSLRIFLSSRSTSCISSAIRGCLLLFGMSSVSVVGASAAGRCRTLSNGSRSPTASGRVANRSALAVGPRAGSYWADRRDGRRPIGHRDSLGLAADLALGIVSTIAFGYRAFVGAMLPAGMPAIQTPLSATVEVLGIRAAGHGVLPSKP